MQCAFWVHVGERYLIPQQDELLHGDRAGGQQLLQRLRQLWRRLPVPGAMEQCREGGGGGTRATALTSCQHCSRNARYAGEEDWEGAAAAHQTSTSVHLSCTSDSILSPQYAAKVSPARQPLFPPSPGSGHRRVLRMMGRMPD